MATIHNNYHHVSRADDRYVIRSSCHAYSLCPRVTRDYCITSKAIELGLYFPHTFNRLRTISMNTAVKKPASREATYEDLCRVPDNLIAEIIDGELYTQPRPAPRHARSASVLNGKISPPFDFGDNGPGGWVILFEPELHLGPRPQIIVPDLAGWRRERMPALPETAWFELAPDWVCEVLSPTTAVHDRIRKMPQYAKYNVQYLWLIDPLQKTLEAFRLQEGKWLQLGAWAEDETARIEPFDAIELTLTVLWY